MAQRFDPASLTLAGDAVPITERLGGGANGDNGMFTASANPIGGLVCTGNEQNQVNDYSSRVTGRASM